MNALLRRLDAGKAPGPDRIHPALLKDVAEQIAPSITIILNKSLSTGRLPASFQEAGITPILKSNKSDPAEVTSYRGISLLPVISELLESIVQAQLMEFLDSQGILSDTQFGFRKGRSTEDLLAKAINDWALSKDKGRHTAVAFIDLSKAFDKVDHQALPVSL